MELLSRNCFLVVLKSFVLYFCVGSIVEQEVNVIKSVLHERSDLPDLLSPGETKIEKFSFTNENINISNKFISKSTILQLFFIF